MSHPARPLVFVDTETTSLNRRTRRAWDVGYIIRRPGEADVEKQFFIEVDLEHADPFSLKIGHFYERHPNPFHLPGKGHHGELLLAAGEILLGESAAACGIAQDFKDAILVGAVPSFDEETLANLLLDNWLIPTWHYQLVDVETLAAGRLVARGEPATPPWSSDALSIRMGLDPNNYERHTALGDARWARDLFDAAMTADVI
jgi:DNA polymerase III epsilon subunit-like protein